MTRAPLPFSGECAVCLKKYESFFSWSEEASDWVSCACIWKTYAQIAAYGWGNVGNGMRGVIGRGRYIFSIQNKGYLRIVTIRRTVRGALSGVFHESRL